MPVMAIYDLGKRLLTLESLEKKTCVFIHYMSTYETLLLIEGSEVTMIGDRNGHGPNGVTGYWREPTLNK